MRIWAIRASIPIIPRLGDVAVLAGLVTAGEQQKVKVSTDQDREAADPATQQSIYKASRKCLFLFAQRLSSQDGNTNSHIAYWQKYQPDIY